MPPSIILEAMQILAGEMELREDTRVAEQARAALEADEFKQRGGDLSTRQDVLRTRCADLAERIRNLPEGEELFGLEIELMTEVAAVMEDATGILDRPDTGPPAIAAETEAIERLLQSKRINPKGGGGGGSTPGGGGSGTTSDAAIALLGKGINPREVRTARVVQQATGETKSRLPAEFRAGLDEYFNRILESTP